MRSLRLLLLLSTGLGACSDPAPKACPDIPVGYDRDLCWLEAVKAPTVTEPSQVKEIASAIGDPIVRSAAVLAWMRLHPKADMQATAPLCALLEGSERNACDRRMQSPHLHR